MSQQGWGPNQPPPENPPPNVNPYAPPTNPYGPPMGWDEPPPNFTPEGNLGAGLAAGFFCGCIGLILVLVIAKGPQTKKGAWIGFVVQAVIGVIMQLVQATSH
jgi:hypothetical protein